MYCYPWEPKVTLGRKRLEQDVQESGEATVYDIQTTKDEFEVKEEKKGNKRRKGMGRERRKRAT